MPQILQVSVSEALLRTRQMLLERQGHDVVSCLGVQSCLGHCERGGFDLFIIGHSMSSAHKELLVDTFRRKSSAPIVALRGRIGDPMVPGVDYHSDTDPQSLLEIVAVALSSKVRSAKRGE